MSAQLYLLLPVGHRTTHGPATASWVDTDGVRHKVTEYPCCTDSGWPWWEEAVNQWRRSIGLTLLALLLLPLTASAQERPNLTLPTLVYAGAASLDLWSTADCLSVGCRERNPAVNWLQSKGTVPMLAFGAALETSAYLALKHWIAPRHPRVATVTIYSLAAAHGFLGVRNLQQARGQRICNLQPQGTRC